MATCPPTSHHQGNCQVIKDEPWVVQTVIKLKGVMTDHPGACGLLSP